MSSKRQLKKFVRRSCGAFAAEILIARAAFPEIKREDVYKIVRHLAQLQQRTLSKINLSYDHTPADSDPATYSRERRKYFRTAYHKLIEEFMNNLEEILKDMNGALPEGVKAVLKETSAE